VPTEAHVKMSGKDPKTKEEIEELSNEAFDASESKDHVHAQRLYRRALELDSQLHERDELETTVIRLYLAEELEECNEYVEADKLFAEVLRSLKREWRTRKEDGDFREKFERVLDHFNNKAQEAISTGKPEEALAGLKNVMRDAKTYLTWQNELIKELKDFEKLVARAQTQM